MLISNINFFIISLSSLQRDCFNFIRIAEDLTSNSLLVCGTNALNPRCYICNVTRTGSVSPLNWRIFIIILYWTSKLIIFGDRQATVLLINKPICKKKTPKDYLFQRGKKAMKLQGVFFIKISKFCDFRFFFSFFFSGFTAMHVFPIFDANNLLICLIRSIIAYLQPKVNNCYAVDFS